MRTNILYRAKGLYGPTGRNSFITNVWRETEAEAREDIHTYGREFKNTSIAEKNLIEHLNTHGKQKNPYPRMR